MLSCVSRSFYSRAPSVHQHCHFRALHGNFLWVCFPQGDKIHQSLGKITRHTTARRNRLVQRYDTRACILQTQTKYLDQKHDSYQVNVAITDRQLLGYVWFCGSHHFFLFLLTVAHFNAERLFTIKGFFYFFLYNLWTVFFMLEIMHTENCMDSHLWERNLPVMLLVFSFPGLFTPLLLWLAF